MRDTEVYKPPSPWTEVRTSLLRQLWGNGLSASEIMRSPGFMNSGISRSAVISKARRLKLARRENPIHRSYK